jgi:hypothetical protein
MVLAISRSGSMKGDPALAAPMSSRSIARLARTWEDGKA